MAQGESHFPTDHPFGGVYRTAAGIGGLVLAGYGVLGFIRTAGDPFVAVEGESVFGLTVNPLLSLISVVMGAILFLAMLKGGNAASTVNIVAGSVFILAGLAGLPLLNTDLNIFAFTMANVIFSMVAGSFLLTAGLYGRVTGGHEEADPTHHERVPASL